LHRDVYYSGLQTTDSEAIPPIVRGSPNSPVEKIVYLKDLPGDHDYDEFFMMGDNSPHSYDGRLWTDRSGQFPEYWHLRSRFTEGAGGDLPPGSPAAYRFGRVPRDHLIGRAFFVYWPAGLRTFRSPLHIIPSVGKMRLIH
jgi:hypothetical protein